MNNLFKKYLSGSFVLLVLAGLALTRNTALSSDDYNLDPLNVSSFQWVTPRVDLDPRIHAQHSNNNVSIVRHKGRLYFAWRTSPDHFASAKTVLYLMSSGNEGLTWDYETEFEMQSDLREPIFLSLNGHLYFYFFQGGTNKLEFDPHFIYRAEKLEDGPWSKLETTGLKGEVPWEIKVHKGVAYMTSYRGPHYTIKPGIINVMFKSSTDGLTWKSLNADPDGVVYKGGVSEVGFEFDEQDNLWGVTRLEDGDSSGWGSHVIYAPANHLGDWVVPKEANPERYDSPHMFSSHGELYLVSRRDVGGPFDKHNRWMPFNVQRWYYLAAYSLRKKRSAVFHLVRETHELEWVQDLPGTGDNAYPSLTDASDGGIWIANYSSPLDKISWNWITGQLNKLGTNIYLLKIKP